MSIPIIEEPEPGGMRDCERCCFCRTPTAWWTALPERSGGQQVACCQKCAKNATPAAVPSKDMWCEREAIAMGPTLGDWLRFAENRDAFQRKTDHENAHIRMLERKHQQGT